MRAHRRRRPPVRDRRDAPGPSKVSKSRRPATNPQHPDSAHQIQRLLTVPPLREIARSCSGKVAVESSTRWCCHAAACSRYRRRNHTAPTGARARETRSRSPSSTNASSAWRGYALSPLNRKRWYMAHPRGTRARPNCSRRRRPQVALCWRAGWGRGYVGPVSASSNAASVPLMLAASRTVEPRPGNDCWCGFHLLRPTPQRRESEIGVVPYAVANADAAST